MLPSISVASATIDVAEDGHMISGVQIRHATTFVAGCGDVAAMAYSPEELVLFIVHASGYTTIVPVDRVWVMTTPAHSLDESIARRSVR